MPAACSFCHGRTHPGVWGMSRIILLGSLKLVTKNLNAISEANGNQMEGPVEVVFFCTILLYFKLLCL
jgi:hypothetical protein